MAKGDTGGGGGSYSGNVFGSQKPLIGQGSLRQKISASNTNEMGEQQPLGWQEARHSEFAGPQQPQRSMFQNMGRMGNMMGQFSGGMNKQPGFGQQGGFNAGPNMGVMGGGFTGGMARPQVQGPNGESPNQRAGGFQQRMQSMFGGRGGQNPYRMFGF